MIDYENMSTGAKRIFECADLFGSGGKTENADFASQILRAAADEVASPIPDDCTADVFNRQLKIRAELLAIAAELEAKQSCKSDFDYQCYIEDYK